MANKVQFQYIVDELKYDAYAYNRKLCPELSVKSWECVFPNAIELEKRLQEENDGENT